MPQKIIISIWFSKPVKHVLRYHVPQAIPGFSVKFTAAKLYTTYKII
jgi:hypothetical protein